MDNESIKKQKEIMKKPVPKTEEERQEMDEITLDSFCGSSCASDCTGLIPSDPDTSEESDSYRSIYPYGVPLSDEMTEPNRRTYGKKGTHGGI